MIDTPTKQRPTNNHSNRIDTDIIFRQSHLVIVTMDSTGVFTSLNPAAEQCFKQPATALIGQSFETVLDLFSHTKARLMLERTIAEGGVEDWELNHPQPGGPPILIGYTTSVLRSESGAILGIVAIGRDLTKTLDLTARLAETNQHLEGTLLKLEKTHAELKSTQAQLVQSEKLRALGQMVAGVAHEVNTPAAFIANNLTHLASLTPKLHQLFAAYAALRPHANAEQQAAITAAETTAELEYLWGDLHDLVAESHQGIERISGIVLSLRNFARLDEAALKAVDINEGLSSTIRIVRPLYADNIDIIEQYASLPPLWGHPGELNQVFLNLLTNALQAIPGRGTIWVSSAYDNQTITVTIKDTGVGMDATTLTRLGEPFFTTKPVGAGSGLGLAVSFGIIERHRGQLRFASMPDTGTTATVILPIHQ